MRGIAFILEAAIVIAIILSSASFIFGHVPKEAVNTEIVYECMNYEYNSGEMGYYVEAGNEGGFKDKLSDCIPKYFDFDLSFCKYVPCQKNISTNGDVYIIDYLYSRNNTLIRVWLWKK